MAQLALRVANKATDGHRLLQFKCFPDQPPGDAGSEQGEERTDGLPSGIDDGSAGRVPFWMLEIEQYIRVLMLRQAHHVVILESDVGDIAGVSAFDRTDVDLGRRRDQGWRLEVIALALAWQRKMVDADIEGCPPTMRASEYLLRSTFRFMLAKDAARRAVVGRVHDANRPSMAACARVGLNRLERVDPTSEYWPLFGEVAPAWTSGAPGR